MNSSDEKTHLRPLMFGETIVTGDVYLTGDGLVNPRQSSIGSIYRAGHRPTYRPTPGPVPNQREWIPYSVDEPAAVDGWRGKILILFGDLSFGVHSWETRGGTHWMPLSGLKIDEPIKVDGHILTFNSDGTVTAGCQKIDKNTMREIVGRWQKACK